MKKRSTSMLGLSIIGSRINLDWLSFFRGVSGRVFLFFFMGLLVNNWELGAQPIYDEKTDPYIVKYHLDGHKEAALPFSKRVEVSDSIVRSSTVVALGEVGEREMIAYEGKVYERMEFTVEHFFTRDSTEGSKIIYVLRKTDPLEGFTIDSSGQVKTTFYSDHHYRWGLFSGEKYIFFLRKDDEGNYQFTTQNRQSLLLKIMPSNEPWLGLCGIVFENELALNNYFENLQLPNFVKKKTRQKDLKNETPMRVTNFYPRLLRAGTGETLTIEGYGYW